MTAIYRPLLEPLDLTYTQFIVLMALWEEDQVSISQLANRAGLSKATMTPLLKRLEQKGLIKRELSPDSERQKQIVLTTEGQKISERSEAITKQAFCDTGLDAAEAKQMIQLCNKLLS
ncbi:MarR family winged helix-turn-helix transcriptional regulator [Aliamphritea ceti]|uniref:MarR family winged helix-turn-helix transcriptional regulator n=1 Tax=Aliamphritea ceti TaxID=1524258 RepID=UPI0021C31366|nr:MarR family transcriptional regulator [Aliamphritea ceti]